MQSNAVYIPTEFNGEFAITGNPRHLERDVMYLINVPYIIILDLLGKGYFHLVSILIHIEIFSILFPFCF